MKWNAPTVWVVAVLVGAAVFILPLAGVKRMPPRLSTPAEAQEDQPGLPAATPQEASLLAELLRLDTELAAAADRREEARAAEGHWRLQGEKATGRMRELGDELGESRARLAQFLRFTYQAGSGGFLVTLVGEGNWMEMVTRWELLRYILSDGLQRLQRTEDLAAAQQVEQARLAEAGRAASESRKQAEELWRKLSDLKGAREKALAEARRQGTDLGQEAARMSRLWQELLPGLRGHLQAFAAFPWQSVPPDRLALEPPAGLRLEIGEETLNRAFAGYPALQGVIVRFFTSGLVLEGQPAGAPAYRLVGSLALEGNDVLRLVPRQVNFADYQADEALLRELADPEELSFQVQEDSGFHVTGLEMGEGKMFLYVRPRQ